MIHAMRNRREGRNFCGGPVFHPFVKQEQTMSGVAFSTVWLRMPRMKGAFVTAFLAALTGVGLTWAAPSDPSPPPPPAPVDQPDRPPPSPDRDHRPHFPQSGNRMPGMFPHEGGDHGDVFRHLSEGDRQKLRQAFEKAWNTPEVMQAREQLIKANEQYRDAVQKALEQADPEAAKILERSKADSPGPRHGPFMPDPGDPDFMRKAQQRLAEELQGWTQGGPEHERGERHEVPPGLMRVHERIMQSPPVRDAVGELAHSDPSHKLEAWKHLKEVYQTVAKGEIAKLREGQQPTPPPPGDGPPPK